MSKATALLATAIFVFAPPVLRAQTLDELGHPLLTKGKAAVVADYDTWAVEHGAVDVEYGSMSYYQPEYALTPSIAIGLGRNVQLTVNGAYQWPTIYSEPVFESWSYFHLKNRVSMLSGDLVVRPSPTLELGAFVLGGRAHFDMDYARTLGVNAFARQDFRTTIVSLRGTWLPGARPVTTSIGADLSGLNHPFLRKNRSRFDWEIGGRWYASGFSDTNDGGPDSVSTQAASRDVRLRFAATHALTDRLQVAADAYWHPAFRRNGTSSSVYLDRRGAAVRNSSSSSDRFEHVYGLRLDARSRPTTRLEAFATGTWEPQTVAFVSAPNAPAATYRTSTFMTGGTWLSRAPRRSQPRVADLAGLYHPLVEPKQIELDGFAYFLAYREPGGAFDLDVRLYRVRATTSIFTWLQASGYLGALLSKHWLSHGAFERDGSYGGELRLRIKSGTELYGALAKHEAAFVGHYPMFVLGAGSDSSFDFTNPGFEGTYTAHLGVRLVF